MYHQYTRQIFFMIIYVCTIVRSTHFRGSMISWRIINDTSAPLVVQIFQRHAWRYTYYSPYCTESTIANGSPILGQTAGYTIACVSNCPSGLTTLGTVAVPCTGYNIDEQYAMGEGRFTINVPQNSNFTATFTNNAWFALVTGTNLVWSVAVQIQTFKRTDTGCYNNAPIITMLPIYRLRNNVTYSLKINVADNDFDPYICLWSQGPLQCGGLSNSVPAGTVDNFGCYIHFTPHIAGYYAAALTVEDFMVAPTDISSTAYLSQVPIQFVFHVYDSPYPCITGPIYIGDLVPDFCIYIPVGATTTTRVRFQVQCAGANVTSYISTNPTNLLTTPIQQDPFDPTIFTFLATFTADADQIGQNLFCFAAIDSIGNQGDSACLRFTVSSDISSLQPLYIQNATRYPMETVAKNTSLWTIYTNGRIYVRPTTETYIRFKRASDNSDYYILNVMTATENVLFLNDSIVIHSSVVWTPGGHFYIYFDAGVFIEASTCTKEAMPISDPTFWPFDIPYETTTTSTTSTVTTSVTSTTRGRTTPTRRTMGTSTTTTTTSSPTTSTSRASTIRILSTTIRSAYQFSTSVIVSITLACLFVFFLLIWIILIFVRLALIHYLLLKSGLHQQMFSIHSEFTHNPYSDRTKHSNHVSIRQIKLATRHRQQKKVGKYAIFNSKSALKRNLVDIEG